MDDILRVALYARVSSQRQTDEATIQSQVAALENRIRADGHHLEPELRFLDDGVSGGTLVRPALERLRDLVYLGGVDCLYVHSPDRLARKFVYQAVLLENGASSWTGEARPSRSIWTVIAYRAPPALVSTFSPSQPTAKRCSAAGGTAGFTSGT